VLDELLLGDPARRFAFGLTLAVLASITLAWVEWRVRRRGETYLAHRAMLAFGAAFAPIGVAVMISVPWGLLGVAIFTAVAMVAFGIGVLAMRLGGVR
jgi:hypothetical protein